VGDVQQRVQESLDGVEGALDAPRDVRRGVRKLARRQRRDEQLGGFRRLKQVVAGGGEEAGLGEVRGFRGVARATHLRLDRASFLDLLHELVVDLDPRRGALENSLPRRSMLPR
jgi:hypothetical protein